MHGRLSQREGGGRQWRGGLPTDGDDCGPDVVARGLQRCVTDLRSTARTAEAARHSSDRAVDVGTDRKRKPRSAPWRASRSSGSAASRHPAEHDLDPVRQEPRTAASIQGDAAYRSAIPISRASSCWGREARSRQCQGAAQSEASQVRGHDGFALRASCRRGPSRRRRQIDETTVILWDGSEPHRTRTRCTVTRVPLRAGAPRGHRRRAQPDGDGGARRRLPRRSRQRCTSRLLARRRREPAAHAASSRRLEPRPTPSSEPHSSFVSWAATRPIPCAFQNGDGNHHGPRDHAPDGGPGHRSSRSRRSWRSADRTRCSRWAARSRSGSSRASRPRSSSRRSGRS